MVAPFSNRFLHSLSRYSPQGVFSYSRRGLLVSITVHSSTILLSPLSEKRPTLVFFNLPLFFLFQTFQNNWGSPFLTPDAFSLVGPYESNLETQFNRAHCRIIRQSSSPLVSSQIGRRPTHAVMTKPLRPTVTVLPPLMTIHHCVCKATVSCLGSDLVHSSMARLLYVALAPKTKL
ncbi:uncharacterized protein TNCV_4803211 [Trichonephila clavipes]|nr:uncharacterized protein TNCV_4803211 [Trichonephila clavipes]